MGGPAPQKQIDGPLSQRIPAKERSCDVPRLGQGDAVAGKRDRAFQAGAKAVGEDPPGPPQQMRAASPQRIPAHEHHEEHRRQHGGRDRQVVNRLGLDDRQHQRFTRQNVASVRRRRDRSAQSKSFHCGSRTQSGRVAWSAPEDPRNPLRWTGCIMPHGAYHRCARCGPGRYRMIHGPAPTDTTRDGC